MKNYIGPGQSLTLTAPAGGVTSGTPVVIGGLLVVPKYSASENEEFTAYWMGIFTLNKVSANTPTQLAKAYWKADTEEVTTTATGNTLIGVFNQAGVNGQTAIEVLLTGEVN